MQRRLATAGFRPKQTYAERVSFRCMFLQSGVWVIFRVRPAEEGRVARHDVRQEGWPASVRPCWDTAALVPPRPNRRALGPDLGGRVASCWPAATRPRCGARAKEAKEAKKVARRSMRGASGPGGDESDGDGASLFTTAPPTDQAGTAQWPHLSLLSRRACTSAPPTADRRAHRQGPKPGPMLRKRLPARQSRRGAAGTRAGAPCRGPAMLNGRCRMHGGTSNRPAHPRRAGAPAHGADQARLPLGRGSGAAAGARGAAAAGARLPVWPDTPAVRADAIEDRRAFGLDRLGHHLQDAML
jgi:hypothetical protein